MIERKAKVYVRDLRMGDQIFKKYEDASPWLRVTSKPTDGLEPGYCMFTVAGAGGWHGAEMKNLKNSTMMWIGLDK